MLDDLDREQEALIDPIAEEYISDAHSGDTRIDQRRAADCLAKIYALAELKAPEVIFLAGPMDALAFCKEALKQDVGTIDYFGVGFDSGWVSFYDYFQRIGVLERDDEEFNAVRDFLRSGVWAVIMFEGLVVCIARPRLVKVDEKGNLHCADGPAIAFDDGYEEYVWHGTWVDEKVILHPEKLTKKDLVDEKNSEVTRAMAEKLGWDRYMELCDTVLVDKWFDSATSSHYELWDFKKRWTNTPRLLKMESSELNDGTRPYYIEPVPPTVKTCQSARRWQCDPNRPEPKECNENPALEFEVEA